MRSAFVTLLLLVAFSVNGQQQVKYYDFYWKPCAVANARFYSTLEKTDSGWFRNDYYINSGTLQMQGLFEDEACKVRNGYFLYVYPDQRVQTASHYIHGSLDGVYVSFYQNGMMSDSGFYENGRAVGSRMSWHRNGYLSDSVSHNNDSLDTDIGFFDDGQLAYAGLLLRGEPHGKWKYYHHNGQISALEVFEDGKALSKTYFNEDGSALTDTSKANSDCSFKKGGSEGWKRYLENQGFWPNGFKLVNGDHVTVGVQFTVNEEGAVTNAEIVVPFTPEFDNAALTVIRNSGKWVPAVEHNRKVKQVFRQPITFSQQE